MFYQVAPMTSGGRVVFGTCNGIFLKYRDLPKKVKKAEKKVNIRCV